ncbi:hypothetical protein Tco_1438228 [Tanacetum coccineum]
MEEASLHTTRKHLFISTQYYDKHGEPPTKRLFKVAMLDPSPEFIGHWGMSGDPGLPIVMAGFSVNQLIWSHTMGVLYAVAESIKHHRAYMTRGNQTATRMYFVTLDVGNGPIKSMPRVKDFHNWDGIFLRAKRIGMKTFLAAEMFLIDVAPRTAPRRNRLHRNISSNGLFQSGAIRMELGLILFRC